MYGQTKGPKKKQSATYLGKGFFPLALKNFQTIIMLTSQTTAHTMGSHTSSGGFSQRFLPSKRQNVTEHRLTVSANELQTPPSCPQYCSVPASELTLDGRHQISLRLPTQVPTSPKFNGHRIPAGSGMLPTGGTQNWPLPTHNRQSALNVSLADILKLEFCDETCQ